MMDTEEDDDDESPTVFVAGRSVSLDEVNDELIAQMTHQEKETYIQIYQEHYSHMYDWVRSELSLWKITLVFHAYEIKRKNEIPSPEMLMELHPSIG